jgi:nucleotide-binding universal stress UspA family protein
METAMKVLLPIDGSEHSDTAVEEVARRQWPAGTDVEVLTVIHTNAPMLPDPAFVMAAVHHEKTLELQERAPELVNAAAERIRERAPQARVTTRILEGPPIEVILSEASEWGADLIVLGSHGRGRIGQALLGSVASSVAAAAPCAVEIIRRGRHPVTARGG